MPAMITVNDVYRKIKEMSCRSSNPRPAIQVAGIASEMQQGREQILPMLAELRDMRLIKFEEPAAISVKLTLLGFTVTR